MMKKNRQLLLRSFVAGTALFLAGTTAFGQVLFNQDFSTASGTTPPAGWANIDNAVTTEVWSFGNPGFRAFTGGTPGFSGQFAILDSDNYGFGGSQNADLETASFDASIAGTYVLEFDNNWEQCCGAVGTVQVWNGTTWSTVLTLPNSGDGDGAEDPSTHEYINITSAVGTATTAKVRFHYEGDWDYWWAVDNIKVSRLSCTPPSATYTIVPNCASNEFSVSVNISSMGSATSIAITEGATTFATATATGSFVAGPFISNTSHTLTLNHNLDNACNVVSAPQIFNCLMPNDFICSATTLVVDGAADCLNTSDATSTGDPSDINACSTPNNTVWYKFTPAVNGPLTVTMTNPVAGDGLMSWIFLYTIGADCNNPVYTQIPFPGGCQEGSTGVNGSSTSSLTGSLVAGTEYYLVIDGNSGDVGSYCISLSTPPSPPSCVTNILPADATTNLQLIPTDPVFSWNADATATSYDFYLGTSAATAVNIGTVTGTSTPVSGLDFATTYFWYVVPTNVGGSPTGCDINATSFTTQAVPPPPTNDECASAIPVNGNSGWVVGYNMGANTSSGLTSSCNAGASATAVDVWYSVTADFSGDIEITMNQITDVVIDVYSGTCASLSVVDCTDDGYPFVFTATEGSTYYVRVRGYEGEEGTFGILVGGTALPVKMDKLEGKITTGNLAQLSWNTLTEQNNKGFEIQRSIDGKNFNTVGFVASKANGGNSNEKIAYNFTDREKVNGSVYYRLQQTDIDGKTALSNVVRLSTKENGAFEVIAAPNPVKNAVTVRTVGVQASNAIITVTDVTGKVMSTMTVNSIETVIDMNNFAQGIYLIKYTDAEHNETIKVSKQ